MDRIAVNAAAEITGQRFRSFSDATRGVLEMLEQQLPGSAVFVGHFDDQRFRIVDARGDQSFDLEAGSEMEVGESFCIWMAKEQAPYLTGNAAADPVYGRLAARDDLDIGSYAGVPLELGTGHLVGSLCAIAHDLHAYSESDLQLLRVLANLLSYQLERDRAQADLEALARQLREQAATDPLTGLLNRRSFDDALEREWTLSARDGIPSYLVMLELDGLKEVNDEHGHSTGDEMLIGFADALRVVTRQTDVVGRLGGDEFGVILVRALGADAHGRFVERLKRAMRTIDAPLPLDVSAGVAGLATAPSTDAARDVGDAAMHPRKSH